MRRLGVETTPGTEERYPAVPRPLTVDATWVSRYVVDTKFIKLAVETKLVKLGVEMKGRIDDASSAGSMKLLMYLSSPAVVEMRFGLEIKFKRF